MRKVIMLSLTMIIVLALAACGGNKVDEETADKYSQKAEEVILLLSAGDYEELHNLFNGEMKAALPLESMGELTPLIEEAGAFEKVDKFTIEEKDGHFTTVSVAKYSKGKRVFTISFNEQDEVVGLFIK